MRSIVCRPLFVIIDVVANREVLAVIIVLVANRKVIFVVVVVVVACLRYT